MPDAMTCQKFNEAFNQARKDGYEKWQVAKSQLFETISNRKVLEKLIRQRVEENLGQVQQEILAACARNENCYMFTKYPPDITENLQKEYVQQMAKSLGYQFEAGDTGDSQHYFAWCIDWRAPNFESSPDV